MDNSLIWAGAAIGAAYLWSKKSVGPFAPTLAAPDGIVPMEKEGAADVSVGAKTIAPTTGAKFNAIFAGNAEGPTAASSLQYSQRYTGNAATGVPPVNTTLRDKQQMPAGLAGGNSSSGSLTPAARLNPNYGGQPSVGRGKVTVPTTLTQSVPAGARSSMYAPPTVPRALRQGTALGKVTIQPVFMSPANANRGAS